MKLADTITKEKNISEESHPNATVPPCPHFTKSTMQHALSHLRPILTKSARTTSQLIKFPTSDIADALLHLKLPHGGYIPDIHMFSPSVPEPSVRICGPAYTVRMVPISDTTAPKLSSHFVDTTPEGSIIVIGAPPGEYLLLL